MDFIFMLTRNDRTVVDCMEVLESVSSLGLKHIGFKDVGVPTKTLKALTTAIKDMAPLPISKSSPKRPRPASTPQGWAVNSASIACWAALQRLIF